MLNILPHKPEVALLGGIVCGAVLFLMRSKEPHWLRKAVYFCLSLAGGYMSAPWLHAHIGWLPLFLVGLFTSASIVAVATIVLDWSETAIPGILNRLVDRVIGGKNHE